MQKSRNLLIFLVLFLLFATGFVVTADSLLFGQSAESFDGSPRVSLHSTDRTSVDQRDVTFVDGGETDTSEDVFSEILLSGGRGEEESMIQADLDAVAQVWVDGRKAASGVSSPAENGINFSDAEDRAAEVADLSLQDDVKRQASEGSGSKRNVLRQSAALSLVTVIGIFLLSGKRFSNR
jgi:hypothetical protein